MLKSLPYTALRASILALFLLAASLVPASAQMIQVPGSTGQTGVSLVAEGGAGIEIHYEMGSFAMDPVEIRGETLTKISLPGVFLPNDAGAPDLPGMGRFVAIPNGAAATFEIVSFQTRRYENVNMAPAPVLPKESEDGPLVYEENPAIFSRDAFYPESPVMLSEVSEMRGVDMVTLGITPFQYNPVTRELIVYTEMDIRVDFQGGDGTFGESRLRSRFWEPILQAHLTNYSSLPQVDFDRPRGDRNGYEYVIISPDNPEFLAWADTLKTWRKAQGISTEVFTTTDIGGVTAPIIEAWLNNAYNTWDPAPTAFLILGDYPNSGFRDDGITSPIWNSYCVSDNIYADVNNDNLPDMVHARITGRDGPELGTMIGKMLDYERNPYTDPGFYDHPIMAGGWQTERWFILCTEILYGHQANALGKNPVREYAIYSGSPGSSWSSNQNTYLLVNYFGPNGLGYIPATPQHLTDWGANATRVNNAINSGAYMLMHRDHGYELGWGEPDYSNSDLSGLHNDMLPFVFSMNCLTGKYNYGNQSFTEAFHRMSQGALGLIAASEVSYSFVNDTFIFGIFDTMWPDFMPDYGPYPPPHGFNTDLRPAFGMASGKYFLQSSNWPYNSGDKTVTHHLFHHHGDAFLTIYSEVPQNLTVDHGGVIFIGLDSFEVQADAGAFIALTVNGEIVGTAEATGMPQQISIIPQDQPGEMKLVVTKANYYRHEEMIPILPPSGPYLVFHHASVLDLDGDEDGILDLGEEVDLELTLENVGVDLTTGVSATISTEDSYIEILTASADYPDIAAGGLGTCLTPYRIRVIGNPPDGHTAVLAFDVQATEGLWDGGFGLNIQAPVIQVVDVIINDSAPYGDGDGVPEPDEQVQIHVRLSNTGSSDAGALTGRLSCWNMHVTLPDMEGECPGVPVGGEALMGDFVASFHATFPSPGPADFSLMAFQPGGYGASLGFRVDVGGWLDDAETDRGWTLGVPGDNATTGIWVREEPVGTFQNGNPVQPEYDHTADPGEICFVTGNGSPGGSAGEADVDGGITTLLSPVFELAGATNATVTYWRWYTNNQGNAPNSDFWDVDVTSDGVNWVVLEHTMTSDASWTEHTFDLGQYVELTDQVRLRFIARDEGDGSLVEAAVDDFLLVASFSDPTSVPDWVRDEPLGIVSFAPNPFNPRATISYRLTERGQVSLSLYDVAGRRVRTLVEGEVAGGIHTEVFDGFDNAGRNLPSGIYFLRLSTPEVLQVQQVTLLK